MAKMKFIVEGTPVEPQASRGQTRRPSTGSSPGRGRKGRTVGGTYYPPVLESSGGYVGKKQPGAHWPIAANKVYSKKCPKCKSPSNKGKSSLSVKCIGTSGGAVRPHMERWKLAFGSDYKV
tara:strand:+ start:222 stop:584 length:363 start_codon:yes stop_codon:yes gene_type:complete